jgi:long-chain fatty acid transport protein
MTHAARLLAVSISLGLALLPSRPLPAQDFGFHEVGARAASLGGAFTARADDITAIFYNPAGLAFLDGVRFKTNLTLGSRTLSATRPDLGWTYPDKPGELRGSFFLSWRPAPRISLGWGLYSPFNFDSRWPRSWAWEDFSIATKLNALTFRSAVAVEPLKGLAFSAALDLVSLSVGWDHKIPFDLETYPLSQPAKVTSVYSLRGHSVGFAAGVMWKVLPGLQFGARYQKSVSIGLTGVNSFIFEYATMYDTLPAPDRPFRYVSDLLNMFYASQTVTGRMTMPREIACGVVLMPVRNLSLSFDIQWDLWSEFGQWTFTSVNQGGDLNPGFPVLYREFYGIEPNYGIQGVDLVLEDTMNLKACLEYRAGRWFAFRAGFARNGSSVSDADRTPLYPDPAFNIYSFGAGYEGPLFAIWDSEKTVSQLSLDFFVRYAAADEVTSAFTDPPLIYGAKRFVAGVGVGLIF